MIGEEPIHPAARLRLQVEKEGWTVTEFANRLGVSRITASRLLNMRSGISPRVALGLERIGWIDADYWMRRQAGYDLAMARRAEKRAPVSE